MDLEAEVNNIDVSVNISDGIAVEGTNVGGPRGEKGEKGDKGDPGEKGETGAQGPQGERGEKGDTGEKGEKGDPGEKGEKGDKGDTGATGPRGEKGDTGAQGAQGEPGAKGDKGDKGDTGDAGPANTLTIGTVTGGDTAAATITGTSPNQTLNLTLPKGDKGDKGETGAQGEKGDTGAQGPQGEQGAKGDKGDKGDTGPAGSYAAGDGITIENNTISFDGGDETVSQATASSSFTLDKVLGGAPIDFEALGDTAQNGTPTPDSPVPIQTVTGRQVVSVNETEFEVNLGKNLFNASDSSGKFFGYISWNGQAGGTSYLRAGSNDCCYIIPCKPNTTYALQKAVDPTISANRFRIANAHEVPTKDITLYNTVGTGGGTEDSTIIYTTDSEAKYIVFYCWYYSGSLTANEMAESIQVEKGDTVTDYASYFTPIELCKIGNYQDRIYKDGERWYLEKQTGEAMLAEYKESAERNGTNTSGNYRFRLTVPGVAPAASISTIVPAYCSHLAAGTAGNTWDRISCIALDVGADGYVWLYTDGTKTYSVDNFKTWLEEKSLAYYYPLATPTTTEITNDSLIEQLEAITLETGTNTITVESEDLPAMLKLVAYANTVNGKIAKLTAAVQEAEVGTSLTAQAQSWGAYHDRT